MPAGIRTVAFIALLMAGGCASTPEATRERDAAAKQFEANRDAATLYVYRETRDAGEEDSVLYVDQRLIGATLPGSYFRLYVRPGSHRLHGLGPDNGTFEIDARAGGIYFVSLNVRSGNSGFRLENPARAKRRINECCGLLENWAPGQRPLLR